MSADFPTGPMEVGQLLLVQCEGALAAANRPKPDRIYVAAGQAAIEGCSMMVAIIERVFRYMAFPFESTDAEMACYGGSLAMTVAIVQTGCVPGLDEEGELVDPADIESAHADILGDASIVLNSLVTELPSEEWQRTNVTQEFIPAGGILVCSTLLTVGLEVPRFAG